MSTQTSPLNVITGAPTAAELAQKVAASSHPTAESHQNFIQRLESDIVGHKATPVAAQTLATAATTVSPAPTTAPAPSESIWQKLEGELITIGKDTISVLDKIGSIADKSLVEVATYLPEAAAIAGIIYPPAQAALQPIVAFVQLALNAVAEIKAKVAALPAGLTDAQMLADELQLIEPTALALLAAAGIKADSAYITKIVNFIVALLDLKQLPAATGTVAAS